MKLALIQMKMEVDIKSNFDKSIQFIREASKKGADFICFPEIQLTPFFPQYEGLDASKYAITLDSPYIKKLCLLCKELGVYVSPNFYIKEDGKHYDMSLLIDDTGKIIGKQKMVHITRCDKFYEQDYYQPSEEGFQVFDSKLGKIGIVVCFDRHYPESVRSEVLKGAELIIIPTANTTSEPSDIFQWEIKVQAFQNSVNIAMCNRIGVEDEMTFSGESMVADYNGNTLTLAGTDEEIVMVDVDLKKAAKIRNQKPYINLRRKELYE